MTALVVGLGAAVLAGVWIAYVYRARETPVARRGLLAALRITAVTVLLVLLADPTLPVEAGSGPPARWSLVDGSASMGVAGGSQRTPWERAVEAVARDGEGTRVAVFGGDEAEEALPPTPPGGSDSHVAPFLRRAAEAGAREVTLYTDLRLADVPEIDALRDGLGLDLRVVDVGEPLRTAGIGELEAPPTGRAGEPVPVSIEVFATAAAEADSARVELLRDGELVEARAITLPGPGRTVSVALTSALPDSAGSVLWQARVRLPGDEFEGDDARSAVTEVDPLEGLLALVSLAPDWEPRFLLPVLARVTGLPARGWFAIGEDAFLPMDGSGGSLDADAMARVAQDARLLVVQGWTGDGPAWLGTALDRGRRVLVFPDDAAGAEALGVDGATGRPGEWYAAAATGPLAAAFTGVAWADLAPLSRPLAVDSDGSWALEAERPGGGRVGIVALQEADGRRRGVVLARGFWRWAFRPGAGADAYDRLWSGLSGWLLGLEDGGGGVGLGPETPVAAAGRPVPWRAAVAPEGRIEITTVGPDGIERVDTLAVGADGRATLPARDAGRWDWTARIVAPDSLADPERRWAGRLELDAHTDEFRWPRDTTLAVRNGPGPGVTAAGPGRPLRTTPWPWLLILGLLASEWILRRRAGLR